jgi:hypothetical protein
LSGIVIVLVFELVLEEGLKRVTAASSPYALV